MIVAFHQPNFLPNLGFFYKMSQVDLFVVGSHIQFEYSEGWQRRHKIQSSGKDLWLTVPVFGSQNQLIRDVRIDNTTGWQRKHRKTLEFTYGRGEYKDVLGQMLRLYDSSWDRLVDLNYSFITLLREVLGIRTPIVLDEEVTGEKYNLIINTCKKYGADTYLSGAGAKEYMTEEYLANLQASGISHSFVQRNLTPEYPYSTVHYLLTEGQLAVTQTLKGE